jgi:DNA polymerase
MSRTAAAALLLDWWRTAGADVLCADAPAPWPAAAEAPERRPPAPAAVPASPATAVPASPAAADGDAAWCDAPTLAAFLDRFRALNPGAPIADGRAESGVLLIGEGPSAEDLRTGRPFTGPAGELLDRMLAAIGLDRQTCYITLAAPRRVIAGPVPADALAADRAITRAHVRLAAPRAILLLGGPATASLTGQTAPIGRLRGQWVMIDAGGGPVPALPTYNPAYLLRRPEAKREAWADLQAFRRTLSLPCAF